MKIPNRAITNVERERAFSRAVPTEKASPLAFLSALSKFKYEELESAKICVTNNSHSLTVGDIYMVWNALSSALDHHDGNSELEELEVCCAAIVTGAWDDEMALSDTLIV